MENDKEPENIPPNKLQEDSIMYQMNKISALSLSDEGNSAEIVVLSEVDEAKHDKEDNFSKISHSSVSRAPVNYLRKKLLILDLNGLLADIVSRPPKDRKADKKIANCGGEDC